MSAPVTAFGVPGHTVYVDRRLPPGAREQRTWTCSCGWTARGYDSTAKRAARSHIAVAARANATAPLAAADSLDGGE